jgi:DNA modification methylase
MVDVFEEVRRVMKPTATLWLNYGDCYATSPNGRSAADTKAVGNDDRTFRDKPFATIGGVLKAKDLCMIPNRLAIALQEAGWWVRSEIIWHKPNPMPESIKDRPGSSHEKVWLLSKSQKYFYDHEAVAEPAAYVGVTGQDANGFKNPLRFDGKMAEATKQDGHGRRHAGFNQRWDDKKSRGECSETRNLRNVWTIPTAAFAEAHFATFPPDLAERCIKAGCPAGGHVLDPFGGAGTTGLVADRLQRTATLIELNPEYAALATRRINNDAPLFVEAV